MAEEPQKNRELHLQERRVVLDEKRLLLESHFLKRNFAVVVTFLVFCAICVITGGAAFSSFLNYQAEVAERRLDYDRSRLLAQLEAQRDTERHNQEMDLKMVELALTSPAARSSDPAEVARLLSMVNHLFPLSVRQRAIDALRASAKPDAEAVRAAIDAAEAESLKIESERKRPSLFIFVQSAEDLPSAEKLRQSLLSRGWRVWVADPVEPPKPVVKVEVHYAFDDQARAERLAQALLQPIQAVKAGLESDIIPVRVSEFAIAGEREGNFEIWLPQLSAPAP